MRLAGRGNTTPIITTTIANETLAAFLTPRLPPSFGMWADALDIEESQVGDSTVSDRYRFSAGDAVPSYKRNAEP
jgi:hypothetical protein